MFDPLSPFSAEASLHPPSGTTVADARNGPPPVGTSSIVTPLLHNVEDHTYDLDAIPAPPLGDIPDHVPEDDATSYDEDMAELRARIAKLGAGSIHHQDDTTTEPLNDEDEELAALKVRMALLGIVLHDDATCDDDDTVHVPARDGNTDDNDALLHRLAMLGHHVHAHPEHDHASAIVKPDTNHPKSSETATAEDSLDVSTSSIPPLESDEMTALTKRYANFALEESEVVNKAMRKVGDPPLKPSEQRALELELQRLLDDDAASKRKEVQ